MIITSNFEKYNNEKHIQIKHEYGSDYRNLGLKAGR